MNTDRDARRDPAPSDPPASVTGPYPRGVDEAAGGADSSPLETESTDDRKAKADEDRRDNRDQRNESPRP